jgi:hypothetical protein
VSDGWARLKIISDDPSPLQSSHHPHRHQRLHHHVACQDVHHRPDVCGITWQIQEPPPPPGHFDLLKIANWIVLASLALESVQVGGLMRIRIRMMLVIMIS